MTSLVPAAINVDITESRFRDFGLHARNAAATKTAIARMLGKAVKVRHCPATVSAPRQDARRSGRISVLFLALEEIEKPLTVGHAARCWEGG